MALNISGYMQGIVAIGGYVYTPSTPASRLRTKRDSWDDPAAPNLPLPQSGLRLSDGQDIDGLLSAMEGPQSELLKRELVRRNIFTGFVYFWPSALVDG